MSPIEQRGPGAMTLSVVCGADELPAVASAWARRLSAALEESFQGRVPVRWTANLVSPPAVWISVGPEGRVVGLVRLRWDPAAPEDGLEIESVTPDATNDPSPVERLFGVLIALSALAGLALWIWLIVLDWDRLWNRLSFSGSGDRATKLEVFLLFSGWIFFPALTTAPIGLLQAMLGGPLERLEERRATKREDFVRSRIDPVVAGAVTAGCSAAQSDPETRVELGLGRPG